MLAHTLASFCIASSLPHCHISPLRYSLVMVLIGALCPAALGRTSIVPYEFEGPKLSRSRPEIRLLRGCQRSSMRTSCLRLWLH